MIVLVAPSVDATSTIASMDSHQSCIVFTPSAIAFIVLLVMCIALVVLLLLHIYYPSPPGGYPDLEGLNFRRAGLPVAQGRHKYLCQALPAGVAANHQVFPSFTSAPVRTPLAVSCTLYFLFTLAHLAHLSPESVHPFSDMNLEIISSVNSFFNL
ncbi:hypothetical protein SISNIDRAFT_485365 [Sistotremastrum niveocremeum HHB9708]|uniref:Uncharacterized protein n=1 Tax=Sistotremastrum niveocremeum HHB9708 TaxID=1314777 RepID=A0A164V2M2_9AGAM|nr:hypothetical protein SISNIDRAFT_485365 [Sistotremastrum niveocremeum HHB9708]